MHKNLNTSNPFDYFHVGVAERPPTILATLQGTNTLVDCKLIHKLKQDRYMLIVIKYHMAGCKSLIFLGGACSCPWGVTSLKKLYHAHSYIYYPAVLNFYSFSKTIELHTHQLCYQNAFLEIKIPNMPHSYFTVDAIL